MPPNEVCDSKGDRNDDEEHEPIVHGSFVVPSARDGIQVFAAAGYHPNLVNTKGDESKEDVFGKRSVSVEIRTHGGVMLLNRLRLGHRWVSLIKASSRPQWFMKWKSLVTGSTLFDLNSVPYPTLCFLGLKLSNWA